MVVVPHLLTVQDELAAMLPLALYIGRPQPNARWKISADASVNCGTWLASSSRGLFYDVRLVKSV